MWHPLNQRAHCTPHFSVAVASTDFLKCQAPIRQKSASGGLCCFEVFSVTIRFSSSKWLSISVHEDNQPLPHTSGSQIRLVLCSGKSSINPFLPKSECFQSWGYTEQVSVWQQHTLRPAWRRCHPFSLPRAPMHNPQAAPSPHGCRTGRTHVSLHKPAFRKCVPLQRWKVQGESK